MTSVIYMDNHATTPVDPRVVEAMLPFFTEKFGNAGSRNHAYGWAAEEACDRARGQVAGLIGARNREVVFTSGATESINLAIKGVVDFCADRGRHVVTAATEHKAVLDSCKALERAGLADVTVLPVGRSGIVAPAEVALNGDSARRLAGNLNLRFRFVEGESLLLGLQDVAVSSGSACTSAMLEPSHVLRAIGVNDELAQASIRFGLGRFNTMDEVDCVVERVVGEVRRLRSLSPQYAAAKRGRR